MKNDTYYRGKRVFVSGGAGVIGSELVAGLHAVGARILVGDLKARPADWPANILYRQGDLRDMTAEEIGLFDPQVFIHLAASFERSTETYEFWDEQWNNNTYLSHYLMTLLKDRPALKKVVFASSYLIYDKSLYTFDEARATARSLKETDPIAPRNMTGSAKLNHEIELEFLKQFRPFDVVCARIYRSYGRGSRDVLSRWVRLLLEKKPIDVYHPMNLFDYVFAGDVAEGLLRLGATRGSGIVNLASGKARRVSDALAHLRRRFPAMKAVTRTSDDRFEASQADLALLEARTGWRPKTSLEQGIDRIIAFERQRPKPPKPASDVLITSLSKKVPLARATRAAMGKIGWRGALRGGDADERCLGRHFVDRFWKMPRTDEAHRAAIFRYLKKEGVRAVIPTRDGELPFWSANKKTLQKFGVAVMVSDPHATTLTLDKLRFAEWGRKRRFPAIPTSTDIDDIDSTRYVVKDRFGAGSRRIGIGLSKKAALAHAKTLEHPIFQPYVRGKEHSIDLYVAADGKARGAIVRERTLVVDGESQVTRVVRNDRLARTCCAMAEKMGLYGHAVFQAFVGPKGRIDLIECNSRWGGASSASVHAGLDSIYWFLLESQGATLAPVPFPQPKPFTMVRSPSDEFLP